MAELEKRLGDRFMLVTQNVDGLHERAGSERIIELHGNLFMSRCARCDRPPFPDHELYLGDRVPACDGCHARGEFVTPASELVAWASRAGGETWLVNAEPPVNVRAFEHVLIGQSGTLLPALFAQR